MRGVLVTSLLAAALAGCGGGTVAPTPEIPDPAQLPVPDPDLGEMESALAGLVDDMESNVADKARASDADPEQVSEAFGELAQLYHIFDLLDAASIAYDNARRLQPDAYRWTYLLALVRVDQGEQEAALEGLQRALELRPGAVAAWIRLGNLHLDLDHPEEARRAFETAQGLISEGGGDGDGSGSGSEGREGPDGALAAVRFGLGRVAAALDRPEEAVEHFERALELQPQASTIQYPLAQAYRRLGSTEEAERALLRRGNERVRFPDRPVDELTDLKTLTAFRVLQSLARDTEVPPEQLLGFTLTHLGNVQGTIEPLEGALAEWSRQGTPPEQLARLHYAAGGLLVRQRSDRRAIGHLRAAVEQDPDLVDARVKLGNALARSGRLDEAVAEFSRALERRPGDRELRLKRATALLNQGRAKEAIGELRRLARQAPEDPVSRIRVAEALEASGDLQAADREYRAIQEDDAFDAPALARAHWAYGAFHQRHGRFEAAVDQYRRALELDRDLLGARRDLAAVLGHLGRFGQSAAEYAQVTSAFPDDVPARWGEALALILDERVDEAVQTLERGVAAAPGAVALEVLLARVLATAPDDRIRQGARALELARSAYETQPVPAHAETVAMALAESGSFEEAVAWERRAIAQLTGAAGDRARERLALYEEGAPFRARSLEDLIVTPPAPLSSADTSRKDGSPGLDSGV